MNFWLFGQHLLNSLVFLEKCLAVVAITTQKCSYMIRPVACLTFCPVFDNGLYQMIQGEMWEMIAS